MLFRPALASLAFWIVFASGVRIAIVPPEDCGLTARAELQRAAAGAVEWMKNAQQPDGRYVYLYYADTDETPALYNDVRHAGVTMSLYQAAGRFRDPDALAAADRALAWMIENSEERHGWTALAPGGSRAQLGGSALMLIGLNERRLATMDPRYDELMRGLARFIAEMQRPDGGFYVAYNLNSDEPDRVGTSRYYPGESLWALAITAETFPGEGWDDYAWRSLDFIVNLRDEVENVDFPPLPDQWAAYGLAEMAEWGLSDEQAEYARRLAERFGFLVRNESQREGSWYGRMMRGDRRARASGIGTWSEALGSLWRLSKNDERLADLTPKIEDRLTCISGILAQRQVTSEEADGFAPRPELAAGAWFTDEGETRMDDQQHAFSGLLYTLDMLEDNPIREPTLPGFPRPFP